MLTYYSINKKNSWSPYYKDAKIFCITKAIK